MKSYFCGRHQPVYLSCDKNRKEADLFDFQLLFLEITHLLQCYLNDIGLNRYKAINALIAYVSPDVMDALEMATDFKRTIDVTSISENKGIETRVTYLDGVHIIEVIDIDRFYTKFDFTEGFKPAEDAQKINVLVCSTVSTALVTKFESIYFFKPGQHTTSDGYLYQHRSMWDVFTFPNALNDKIDSIFVDVQPIG